MKPTKKHVSRPSKPGVESSSLSGRIPVPDRRLSLQSRFRLFAGPATREGCIPWLGMRRGLYGAIHVNGKTRPAHRIAYELANGPIPGGMLVRHLCNHPWCVNARHLRAGTHADNQRDKVIAGRQAKGEKNGRAKITENDARLIYYRLSIGDRVTDLANEFGVTRRAIRFIRDGKNWKHIHAKPRQALLTLAAGFGGAI